MQKGPETVVSKWLSLLNISVSYSLVKRQLKSHPEYPSLVSITDTLDWLGIENMAVEIEKDQLHEISTPFLAYLSGDEGEFVIVENRNDLEKTYPGFYEKWNGVVVAAEKTRGWRHPENDEILRKDRNAAINRYVLTGLFLIVVLSAIFLNTSLTNTGLILVALAGSFISMLIVSKELGIENKIADQVCGDEGNCDKVIQSKSIKLPFGISFSDMGIVWFSSLLVTSILSVFAGINASVTAIIAVLSLAVIPFSIFSVYYQWQVAKKWCRLCLITITLLWIQFAILLTPLLNLGWNSVSLEGILYTGTTLLLVVAVWFPVKSLWKQNKINADELAEALKFKRNESVFLALLEKKRRVDITPWERDLQLGNAFAPVQIMVACNTYCSPCAKTHKKLHDLLERYNEKTGLTIRFTLDAENKEDKRTQAVQHILGHIDQYTVTMTDEEKAIYSRQVLHEWFLMMDHEKFIAKYPCNGKIDADNILRMHQEWIHKSEIAFTPTVFINGFEIPSQYTIDDLPGLMNALQESIKILEPVNESLAFKI